MYEDLKIKDNNANENFPKFNDIKTQLYIKLNNNMPSDIENLNEIDTNSIFLKTLKGDQFLIFNDDSILIFQSDIQAKIFKDNINDVFIDGTFYSAPKALYQIIIIRNNVTEQKNYFTTCFALCVNKSEETYKKLFIEVNKNLKRLYPDNDIEPKNIHIDFELALSNAIIGIWNNSKIRYCYFHYHQIIERKMKKYSNLVNNNIEAVELFKRIKTLPLIPNIYAKDIFNLINAKNKISELNEFLDYYEKTFIKKYEIDYWNYFKEFNLRTNNPCENYTNRLNSFFEKKPTFYYLVHILAREESLIKKEYEALINNGFHKFYRYNGGDYYSCLIYYIDKEKEINGNGVAAKKKKINLWFEATLRLPLK